MKLSNHIGKTFREAPKDAQTVAHKFMLRAGYIKQVSPGIYAYMPFLLRALNKISQIIRDEINIRDYEELLMPALQPKHLWVESGRWERYTEIDRIMFDFKDRRGNIVGLGPGHEEVITDIIRKDVNSYKHLPKKLYQIQTKFRDEIRPRFGLIEAREFIMLDAYSFDVDEAGLAASYQAIHEAYHHICKRIGLAYRCVESDIGENGESSSREFIVFADTGEDVILYCDACEYAATQKISESRLEVFPQDKEMKPMEAIHGPGLIGVEPLAEFLKLPVWKTTKTLLFQSHDKVVAVMVRGDCDVNEFKLKRFLKCNELTLASPDNIKELTGAEVGYAGPIGLPPEVTVIADHYTYNRVNFECGANRTDYHYIDVNFGRDFPLPTFGDFKLAKEGNLCPRCNKGKLKEAHGIEIGHIIKLGTKYSLKMTCNYQDKTGKTHPVYMGCYGLNVSRISAAVIEQNHDDRGIIWPIHIAPYQVHLIGLNLENEEVRNEAENFYRHLLEKKIDVLFDDRDLRAGEKFSDADLFGMPVRLTISKKTCKEHRIELKFRDKSQSEFLSYNETLKTIKDFCT